VSTPVRLLGSKRHKFHADAHHPLSSDVLPVRNGRVCGGDNPLLGTWKLKSYVREVDPTGERYNERGEHPNGYLSYAADGLLYAMITWDNCANPHDVVPTRRSE
jgi:hypothetical protein